MFYNGDLRKLLQWKEPPKKGEIQGVGEYTIFLDERCERCGKKGIVHFPESVVGCLNCKNLDLSHSSISYDETESFQNALEVLTTETQRPKPNNKLSF